MFKFIPQFHSEPLPRQAAIPPLVLPSGEAIPVGLRRSKRAIRTAIRIRSQDAAVELVLPERLPLKAGLQFLDSRRDWLIARLSCLESSVPFAEGAIIPVLGRNRILRTGPKPEPGMGPFRITDEAIEVFGRPEHIARRTRDGLSSLAGQALRGHVDQFARKINRTITKVTITNPTSRWGSCSRDGRLRFSWRLILAPETVLAYVAAHEVAHLAQMNHSPAFWRVVAELYPAYESERQWLKRNGARLLRYG